MTVCVAVICENGRTALGASDRMMTSGGVTEFQSPERKVLPLTTSIVVMWSGGAAFMRGILNGLKAEIDARVKAAPAEWLEVEEVSRLFQGHYNTAVTRLAEQEFLAPFGLTMTSFRKSQRQMAEPLVQDLSQSILSYRAPEISALIVGMDGLGGHIYEFENLYGPGHVHCHDAIGFHAIGIGAWHALSQLMAANYGPSRTFAEAMFQVYAAKKRAEVAPGVGTMTDLFLFAPREVGPRAYHVLTSKGKDKIDAIYKQMKTQEDGAEQSAIEATREWFKSLTPQVPPQGQASGPIGHDGALATDTANATVTSKGDTPGPTGPTGPQTP